MARLALTAHASNVVPDRRAALEGVAAIGRFAAHVRQAPLTADVLEHAHDHIHQCLMGGGLPEAAMSAARVGLDARWGGRRRDTFIHRKDRERPPRSSQVAVLVARATRDLRSCPDHPVCHRWADLVTELRDGLPQSDATAQLQAVVDAYDAWLVAASAWASTAFVERLCGWRDEFGGYVLELHKGLPMLVGGDGAHAALREVSPVWAALLAPCRYTRLTADVRGVHPVRA